MKEQEYIQALAERYSNALDPDYFLLDRQYSQAIKSRGAVRQASASIVWRSTTLPDPLT